jgi:hypothetical protein
LPAAEEEVAEAVAVALAEEEAVEEALAEEAVFAIPVEVPVRFKAVNPAVVQVDLEEEAIVPLDVQVVGVLETGNLVVVVLAVFAILEEVPVHSGAVKPVVVKVSLEEVVKAEISEEEE